MRFAEADKIRVFNIYKERKKERKKAALRAKDTEDSEEDAPTTKEGDEEISLSSFSSNSPHAVAPAPAPGPGPVPPSFIASTTLLHPPPGLTTSRLPELPPPLPLALPPMPSVPPPKPPPFASPHIPAIRCPLSFPPHDVGVHLCNTYYSTLPSSRAYLGFASECYTVTASKSIR